MLDAPSKLLALSRIDRAGYRRCLSALLMWIVTMLISASAQPAVFVVTYDGDLMNVDETSGTTTLIGPTGSAHLNGLTRDPTSSRLYAVTQDGVILEINRDTGAGTFVTNLRLPGNHIVRAIAASPTGELYYAHGSLYELSDDMLAKYDPVSGRASDIAMMHVEDEANVATLTALTFAADGRLIGWDQMFYGLIEIDPASAVTRRLGPRGSPGANIETIAYAEDGGLHGIGGFTTAGRDAYFDFDARGVPTSSTSCGTYNIRGMEFRVAADDEEPPPPHVRWSERPQPRPEMMHNLYLVDCGPCPQCMERPCDPRVNPEFGAFLVWDPLHKLAHSFTRKELDLKKEDGPITAAAPLYAAERQPTFVLALPFANKNTGAIVLFNREQRILKRIDGQSAGEQLGVSMDVWQSEIVAASHRRIVRVQDGQVRFDKALATELGATREVRVAFTSDVDGDKRPEILLGTPQAAVGTISRAGRIEVIGSSRNQTIDIQYGRTAGEQLGRSLQPIREHAKPIQ